MSHSALSRYALSLSAGNVIATDGSPRHHARGARGEQFVCYFMELRTAALKSLRGNGPADH